MGTGFEREMSLEGVGDGELDGVEKQLARDRRSVLETSHTAGHVKSNSVAYCEALLREFTGVIYRADVRYRAQDTEDERERQADTRTVPIASQGRGRPASAETRRGGTKSAPSLLLLSNANIHRCVDLAVDSLYDVLTRSTASKKHLDEDSPAFFGLAWIEDLETVK